MVRQNETLNERDFRRIAAAITFLQQHYREQPSLASVASAVGLSESHLQRLFTAWAGISPKRYMQHLTAIESAALLRDGHSVLASAYGAGMSAPSRLHDLMLNVYAATPGEVATGGVGLDITWGTAATPFGDALMAVTDRGVCALHFLRPLAADEALADVLHRWPNASLRQDDDSVRAIAARMFRRDTAEPPLSLLVTGTNFQLQVWRALLRIPAGTVATYEDIARDIDMPTAQRAVGAAVGRNPIALLIPCHRVIRKSGELGGYHWGGQRKSALLAWEAATQEPPAHRTADSARALVRSS